MMKKIFDGRFELEAKLGEGRFARVYRAKNLKPDSHIPDKIIAVKIFKRTSDLDVTTRTGQQLSEESVVLAGLTNDRVVRIYDARFNQTRDRFYLVLQYLEGENLQDLIRKGALSWRQTRRILGNVVEALKYLHSNNVVHGDIKPSNIIVEPSTDWAYLVDFGLAHVIGYKKYQTQTGAVTPGTIHYMAPELWDEHAATPSSDLYALAATVYEMLVGERLFDGTLRETMRGHCDRRPDLHALRRKGVSEKLVAALLKALDKSPEKRHESVAAFYKNIQGVRTTDNPIFPGGTACPTPNFDELEGGKWYTYLKVAAIYDILVQGTYLWAVTDVGLVRWNMMSQVCKFVPLNVDANQLGALRALEGDNHGNLWIATESGLIWGYGTSFRAVPALDALEVRDVLVAHDGKIWAATSQGVVCLERQGERPQWFRRLGHVSAVDAYTLYQPRLDHRLWVGLAQAVAVFDGYTWRVFSAETEALFSDVKVHAITGMFDSVWVLTSKGVLRYKHGRWIALDPAVTANTGDLRDILPGHTPSAPDGVWLGGQKGLFYYDGMRSKTCVAQVPNVRKMVQKDDGCMAIATDTGVVEFSPQLGVRSQLKVPAAPPDNDIRAVVVDKRQSKVWVGSRRSVNCLARSTWQHYPTTYDSTYTQGGPGRGPVLDLAFSKADDSLWVITRKGGVRCFRRGNWHSVYVSALAGRPRALCAAQDGAIWVGLETGLGKVMFDQHAHVALIKGTSTPVSSVIEYAGEVWVGTELGVYVYNQTGTLLKAPRSERKGLYSYTILTLHCAADKLIWAGTPQGAAFFNGTDWTFLSELAGQQVLAIIQSQDGALWFGTDRGLYRHDGVELNWVQAEKVPHVPVRSIAQAASGQLWIATARGLIRFTPPQVRLDAKIRG